MLQWTKKAWKQLTKLPATDADKIYAATQDLEHWPDTLRVKALADRDDYRLRVGRYRIFFTVDTDGNPVVVTIERVERRDEHIYRH